MGHVCGVWGGGGETSVNLRRFVAFAKLAVSTALPLLLLLLLLLLPLSKMFESDILRLRADKSSASLADEVEDLLKFKIFLRQTSFLPASC